MPIQVICSIFSAPNVFDALRDILASQPVTRQAIRIASSSLADAVDNWCESGTPPNAAVPMRALAYLARMSSRPTPFGICAGIGIVAIGERTTLEMDLDGRRTQTRADMQLVANLRKELDNSSHRGRIRYIANTAVLERGGRLYVANILLANQLHNLTEQRPISLRETDAVRFVREITNRLVSYDEISERLSTQFASTLADANKLLDALIEAGVVISELHVSPMDNPIDYLFERFADIDPSRAHSLQQALLEMKELDDLPVMSRTVESYDAVVRACHSLVEDRPKSVVQVDMHIPLKGALASTVLDDAALLGEYLMRMGTNRSLKRFRERFVARYGGLERMVPLLELVDGNLGLGNPEDPENVDDTNIERDALITRLACDAMRSSAPEIELTAEQLATIAPPLGSHDGRHSIEIAFQVAARSGESIERGDYLVVPSGFIGAMGAARSLGRFMHLFEPEAYERAKMVVSDDSHDGPRAEFVYAPLPVRNYNVLMRPRLVDTEIKVGVVDPSESDQLSLDDLWVGVDANSLFLWSDSRQCRVFPMESHVLDTLRLAPNLCRLLSFIGMDGQRVMREFPWGAASTFTALPRVKVGRVVLSPRRWRFTSAEFGRSAKTAQKALDDLRATWNLPRYILLCEGDNRLLLDLDSSITGTLMNDRLSVNSRNIHFQEMLPAPNETWLHGTSHGTYVAEFVASLTPRAKAPSAKEAHEAPIIIPLRWRYGPGSSWLYVKLYLGSQAAEECLLQVIAPAIAGLRNENAIERWFFVRFADPDFHLRVRIKARHGHEAEIREQILSLAERLLANGSISRYVLDTYDPEYERYGGISAMNAVEHVFTVDSDICIERIARAGRTTDARVVLAAESFYPWLLERENLAELALSAFADGAKGKIGKTDREALRAFVKLGSPPLAQPGLSAALVGTRVNSRLAAIFHMHCNRFGVEPHSERRAISLLRAMILAVRERKTGTSEVSC